jgi:hypothetical protein
MRKTAEISANTLNQIRFSGRPRASVYSGVYRRISGIRVSLQFDNRCRRRGCLHRRCIGCGHFLFAFLAPKYDQQIKSQSAAARPDRTIFLFGRALSFRPGHADLDRTER